MSSRKHDCWVVTRGDGSMESVYADGWEVLRSGALWFWTLTDTTPVGTITKLVLASGEWIEMYEAFSEEPETA